MEDNVTMRLRAFTQGKRRLKSEASSCTGDLCIHVLGSKLRGLQRDNVRKSTNPEGEKRLKESMRNEGSQR